LLERLGLNELLPDYIITFAYSEFDVKSEEIVSLEYNTSHE